MREATRPGEEEKGAGNAGPDGRAAAV